MTGITPHAGPTSGGTVVTVTGTSFSQDANVSFGGNPATAVTVNLAGTSLRATSPSGAHSVDVTVTTPAGTSSTSPEDLFAYGRPAVTSVSPDAGPTTGGTTVTVTGTGFAPGAEVDFGTTPSGSVTVDSGTQITASSPPASSGPVDVSVTTSQGTSPNGQGDVFTYGAPVVDSLRPVSGPTTGGTSVTITGTGFTRDATVDFGPTAASSVTITSDTSLTAVSPPGGSGVVDVTVTSPAGTSATQGADQFAYSDQLELSCSPPPYTSPGSTCPGIDLPAVTLDGTEQSTQAPGNTIYIMDNRGESSAGWSVSAYLVPTPGNPPTGCAAYSGFCDWSVGDASTSPNAKIPASDFSVGSLSCTAAPGNTSPQPHVGTGGSFPDAGGAVSLCTADPGSSGGAFELGSTFSLVLPESLFAGTYHATVEYLVM